ncbi:MAG: hypothetical protein ACRD3S_21240, partial [Terracidiphilus sp.]
MRLVPTHPRSCRILTFLTLFAASAVGQAALQFGASYDQLTFRGTGGQQVTASFNDCQSNLCWLEGSAYSTGALQVSGHYTLTAGSGVDMTLTSSGANAFTIIEPNALWLVFETSSGSLAGELQLDQAQDDPVRGQLTITGHLTSASGSLANVISAGSNLTMILYDGSGLRNLLGTAQTSSGSLAPGTVLANVAAPPAGSGTAPIAGAAPPELDAYGGLSAVTIAPATGFFRVQKAGERWTFVDPQGHAFWMLGVFAVDLNTDTSAGASYTLAKYGGLSNWVLQAIRRLRAWGFNSTAEYSSAYVVPVNNDGNYATGEPMPWV